MFMSHASQPFVFADQLHGSLMFTTQFNSRQNEEKLGAVEADDSDHSNEYVSSSVRL